MGWNGIRFMGFTAEDYARMTDAELVRLMNKDGWSYDRSLVAELDKRGLR